MPSDQAFARLREANPVSDPGSLRSSANGSSIDIVALLDESRRRSVSMQTQEKRQAGQGGSGRSRRGVLVAAAVAAVVLAAGVGAAVLATRDAEEPIAPATRDSTTLAPTTTTPPVSTTAAAPESATGTEGDAAVAAQAPIGRAFLDAVSRLDVSQARAVMADNPHIHHWPTGSGVFETDNAWLEATGWEITVLECEQWIVGERLSMSCPISATNAWSRALGADPFTQAHFLVAVEGGHVVESWFIFEDTDFEQAWVAFFSWMEENHPDAIDTLLSDQLNEFAPVMTQYRKPKTQPDSIEFWREFTAEFVTSQEAG